jgi:DNA-directed RNA polymerase subunit RPC12/RpoP
MPMIKYVCKCGNEKSKFFSNTNKILDSIKCEKCGEEIVRTLSSPSQRSKITVDNGVQAKAVELDRQIVEIIEDREKVDLKKRGDAVLENLK